MAKDLPNNIGEAGRLGFALTASNCKNFCIGLELLGRLGGPARVGFRVRSVSGLTFG